VRLVVGTINLVEKIAQLANISVEAASRLSGDKLKELSGQAVVKALNDVTALSFDANGQMQKPKEIIKEGLSEYFIFTIEGTETIPNGWSKRLRSIEAQAVPVKVQYRYRPVEYGDQLVRMYLLTNDEKSQLGTSPLPDGMVRVFRDNGRNGLSYITQQRIKYILIGDKIELNLGVDPEVIFELVKLRAFRDELWLQVRGVRAIRKVGGDVAVKEEDASVVGWDDHEVYSQRIRNYIGKEIEVEIRRSFPGHVVFRSQLEPTLFDYQTPQFLAKVPAGKRADLIFEIVRKQGTNAEQNNVSLGAAEVSAGR
jgi:hypothetical protein